MDQHTVTITLREVYDSVTEQGKLLAAIDKKLDVRNAEAIADGKMLKDHEVRLRDLEKLVWKASGAATILGIAGGAIVNALFK